MAAKKRKYTKRKNNQRDEIKSDIILLVIVALALLLTLGIFHFGGVVITVFSKVSFGLFGVMAYLLPVILLFGALFIFANQNNAHLKVIIISSLFILWFISTIFDLIANDGASSGPIHSFETSYETRTGGGFFGGMLAFVFYKAFGLAGAVIISIILIIIFAIIMTGRSFVKSIHEYSENTNDDRAKTKEMKAEERRILKEERAHDREIQKQEELKERAERHRKEREEALAAAEAKKKLAAEQKKNSMQNLEGKGVTPATDLAASAEEAKKESDEVKEIIKVPAPSMESINKRVESAEDGENLEELPAHEVSRVSVNPVSEENNKASVSKIPPADKADNTDENNDDWAPLTSENTKDSDASASDVDHASAVKSEKNSSGPELPLQSVPRKKELSKKPVSYTLENPDSKDEHIVTSSEEKKPSQSAQVKTTSSSNEKYIFPTTDLLNPYKASKGASAQSLDHMKNRLQRTLTEFGVDAEVTDYMQGPAVTRFEIKPNAGVKVSKIINLSDDIKLNLAVPDIRIEAPIPGKAAVGIEVPNKEASMVTFRELVESPAFRNSKSKIAFAAGKDIAGNVIISDIAKMPHVLIAGATGSGKSVCINTIIMSILYKATPDEVKFIMIDPKIVELSVYNGIPHLLVPVVTDPKKAAGALQWAVNEMTKRYQRFANAGVRDMKSFNEKVSHGEIFEFDEKNEKVKTEKKMPQIVVIVDELADLMMVASKEVESSICRLAQLARAAGIHLVIATQRPSVNVITGLIKANMPSRIAFAVTSGVDSRTILDMNGAEKLLGHGDMLYFPQGMAKPIRVQGTFVDDSEVSKVVQFIKENNVNEETKEESDTISKEIETHANNVVTTNNGNGGNASNGSEGGGEGAQDDGHDDYFADAGRLITDKQKASIGMLQRYLKIGFNRAARIMDELGEAGVVGPEEGTKPRKVLMKKEDFENYLTYGGTDSSDDEDSDGDDE